MKKALIVICVFMFVTQSYACDHHKVKGNGKVETKNRDLNSFDKINLGGSIDLIIDQNGKESVAVETDENVQEFIVTEVKDGELNIYVKKGYNVNSTKLVAHISCKSLNAISSGGSGNVKCLSKITGNNLSVSHGGSGNFELNLDVKQLDISTAGSGDYVLKGNAEKISLSMAGSGNIHANELSCVSAEVSAAGSGDVFLKKGVTASVNSVGSGDVVYE